MIVNSMDNVVNLYNMMKIELEPPKVFRGHKSNFYVRANMGMYDSFILSGSSENLVYVWDIES